MSRKINVVTGATGLLGSHVVEQLVQRGEQVRALVRPTSNVSFLQQLGVELAEGDLLNPESIRRAVRGASVVYHCAAKVGDWGPWKQFQSCVIDAAANLLEAARLEQIPRVLHVSSVTVYGHPRVRPGETFNETEPLGQTLWTWDYYCRSKIAAEKLCREYPGDVTIIRPSWIYGPRDRNTLPRFFKAMKAGRLRIIGSGDNQLNLVYAGDVADGAIRAANSPKAIGQAYNLTSAGEMTQRDLLNLLTDELGRKRIRWRLPYGFAFYLGYFSEIVGRLIRLKRPPHITRYGVGLIGRPTLFSNEKARTELGWEQRMPIEEGMKLSLAWYHESMGEPRPQRVPA